MQSRAGGIIARFQEKLAEHETYIREHGEDLPEVRNWRWESWEPSTEIVRRCGRRHCGGSVLGDGCMLCARPSGKNSTLDWERELARESGVSGLAKAVLES